MYNPDERDLLYSQVIEKIWIKRHIFDGTIAEFRGWVNTMIRNTHIDNYRNNKGVFRVDINEAYNDPGVNIDVSSDIDNKKQIRDLLYTIDQKFNKKYSTIFKMHIVDGYKISETSINLDVPEGTVKAVVSKIRAYISDPANIISEDNIKVKSVVATKSTIVVPKTRIIRMLFSLRDKYQKLCKR